MKKLLCALFLLTCSATPSWGAGLTLSIRDGLVSLDAQDVTVRQILAEWERVGKTRIVNAERVTGGPITLKLESVPEKQALDIILRAIPGYMALPREAQSVDASVYDRILIMATTTPVAAAAPSRLSQGLGFPGAMGGGNVTQLRPMVPLSPGVLPDSPNVMDTSEDAAIAAAAAAGLVPVPAFNPGPTPMSPPMMPMMSPGGPNQPQQPQPALTPPGAGAPTNPWNIPAGTAQPSLAPPQPQPAQTMPTQRVRMPQADQ